MTTTAELLASTVWAPLIAADELARVAADITESQITPGGYVCRKGDPVDAWLGVMDGLVKMSSVSPQGKLATFTGVSAGGWFGEGSLLKSEPRKYDIIALRPTRMARLPRATFEWLLDRSIPFNRFLLKQLNERLGQFIALVEYERLLEPDARVARCIAELYNPHLYPGASATLELSQEEIGYLSGISRQRVNQALAVLEGAGLLRVEYGAVRVLSVDGLKRYPST